MRNNLATLLRQARRSGVRDGVDMMLGLFLICADNIAPDYMDDERVGEFLKDLEEDLNRVYGEVLGSVPEGDVEEMAERIVGYCERIRRERGMDE